MAEPDLPAGQKKAPTASIVIAAALVLAVPLTSGFEGLRTHVNRDPVGYLEVCYGDRVAERRTYTPAECAALLQAREGRDYAPPVMRCTPSIARLRDTFASAIDAAYNAGPGNYCRSPMAAHFNRGELTAGCNAYIGWHTLPGTKAHNGLARRRVAERALCLKGAA